MLSKETFLLAAPALLLMIWLHAYRPTRAFGMVGAIMAIALSGAAYVLFAMLRNELLPGPGHVSLWDAVAFQLGSRESTGSVWVDGSAANGLLDGWLATDVVLLVGGAIAAAMCLAVRRLRPIGLLIATFAIAALRPGGYLPSMFVVVLLPFAALAIAAMLDLGFRWIRARNLRRRDGLATAWRRAFVAAVAVMLVLTAVSWWPKIRYTLTVDGTAPRVAALAYLDRNLDRTEVVVTDNSYWNDLVDLGWSPTDGSAVWFYKIDTDPVFDQLHPQGWREIDYLLWTSVIAKDPAARSGDLAQTYANSRLVRTWGAGEDRIELRMVDGPVPGDVTRTGPGLAITPAARSLRAAGRR